MSEVIKTIWASIHSDEAVINIRTIRSVLEYDSTLTKNDSAALHMALAASYCKVGDHINAQRQIDKSLALEPRQWAAHRVHIDLLMSHQSWETARALLEELTLPSKLRAWDMRLPQSEIHTCLAACCWHIKEWDEVRRHLDIAHPQGLKTMQPSLREDWFRLALYRHKPADAAEAAASLMNPNALEFTDAILQTLVQQGWTGEALPLYRSVFEKVPKNPLLRRRLVALCIKEGEIEEARQLAIPGALDFTSEKDLSA